MRDYPELPPLCFSPLSFPTATRQKREGWENQGKGKETCPSGNGSAVRRHIISQQLLISLISIRKSNGSNKAGRQAAAEGVSVVV